jgi:hypothetical protein
VAETPDPASGRVPGPARGPVPGAEDGTAPDAGTQAGAEDGTGAQADANANANADTDPEADAGAQAGPEAGTASGGSGQAPAPDRVVADAVMDVAGRATIPLQAARADKNFATAFWYNDLIEVGDDRETIRQYLVTSEPQTRYELGQFTLREGLVTPELPADELVMPGFSRKWFRIDELGVAVMPTVDLHLHGERKGWSWSVQEVTEGLAARPEDIASLGPEPVTAYLLGHEVTDPDSRHPGRPQILLEGAVRRAGEDAVVWDGPFPQGCAGAPVFAGLPHEQGLKLVCLGPALPGDPVRVACFDRLRPAVHHLSPARKRHWWQRA